jgi:hypothetical protein
VKYEVAALDASVIRLKGEIKQHNEAMHVLRAEWSHLNEPKRLQHLCAKYLGHLKPVNSTQLITMHDMIQSSQSSSQDKNLDTYMNSFIEKELDMGSKA